MYREMRILMNRDEFISKVNAIIDDTAGFGFNVFACVKTNEKLQCYKFILEDRADDSFKDTVSKKILACLKEKYLSNDFLLASIDDISDNSRTAYSIEQTEGYFPFFFLKDNITDRFDESKKSSLYGFAFAFNANEEKIYAYQQVYPVTIPTNKKGIFVVKNGEKYTEFKKELLRIDYRIDLIVVGDTIITPNITLLQNKFSFDKLIRSEAQKTIESISSLGIIDDMTKIVDFEGKEKLTNAKKLMKIKHSPVLSMDKSVLLNKLNTIPRFQGRLNVDVSNQTIHIDTNKDVVELLKILNDDYLISELTDKPYESASKILDE